MIGESELILNPDGSIYHLHLRPEEVATTIITVGDQDRVGKVSQYFDKILLKKQHREFTTHTGELNGKRLTVISTGIGTDNIDIVLNELDALVNIDFATRQLKPSLTSLDIVRIGTSGVIGKDKTLAIDDLLVSVYAIGLDNLLSFYQNETALGCLALEKTLAAILQNRPFYTAKAANKWLDQLEETDFKQGITLTCSGFYAPQVRNIRLKNTLSGLFEQLDAVNYEGLRVTNMEMETAGIYGLSRLMQHQAVSFNALLANRRTGEFSQNAERTIDRLIQKVLGLLV